jgi:hypothetical protein
MKPSVRTLIAVAEVVLVAVLFGLPATLVAIPSLWISRRYGASGIRFLLATVLVLLTSAAIASAIASTRLEAMYADRRALAENFGGLAAAIAAIAVIESARIERRRITRPHRTFQPVKQPLSPLNEEP